MYSAFYEYACIHTATVEEVFSTKLVEHFLARQANLVCRKKGSYDSLDGFFHCTIMKVSDFDGWAGELDYNPKEANYLDFVINRPHESAYQPIITGLSELLQLPYITESDDE